mgnify:CR=1 FL=1
MTECEDRHSRVTKWLRWIARGWSIPIIVFALIMAGGYAWNWATTGVADPYAVEDVSTIEALPPLLLFVSVVGLGIAWRWERLGGTIALLFQLAALLLLLIDRPIWRDFSRAAIPYLLTAIIAIPAILFLVCWRRSKSRP